MLQFWGRFFCKLAATLLIIPALLVLYAVVRLPSGIPLSVLFLVAVVGISLLALAGQFLRLQPKRKPRDPNAPTAGHH